MPRTRATPPRFGLIAGVPVDVPRQRSQIDWDALLGPSRGAPDDFASRDPAVAAAQGDSLEGPTTMQPGVPDPYCTGRALPSCREEGVAFNPAPHGCDPAAQFTAPPTRRLVEIARRFDQSPRCFGFPCQNGVVSSLCARDHTALTQIVLEILHPNIDRTCIPRDLRAHLQSDGTRVAECMVRLALPSYLACNPASGQTAVVDAGGAPVLDSVSRGPLCEVHQVPVDASGAPVQSAGGGWYLETRFDPSDPNCHRDIHWLPRPELRAGSTAHIECLEAFGSECTL